MQRNRRQRQNNNRRLQRRRPRNLVRTRRIPKMNRTRVVMEHKTQRNLIRRPTMQRQRIPRPPPITKARPFDNSNAMTAYTPEVGCVRLRGSTFLGTANWQPNCPNRPDDTKTTTLTYGAISYRSAYLSATLATYCDNVLPLNPVFTKYMPKIIINQAMNYRQFEWKGLRLRFSTRMSTGVGGLITLAYTGDPVASDDAGDVDAVTPQNFSDGFIKNSVNSWSFPLYNNFVWNVPVTGKRCYSRSYYSNSQFLPSWVDEALRQTCDGMIYFKLEPGTGIAAVDIFDIHMDYDLCLYDPGTADLTATAPPVLPSASLLSIPFTLEEKTLSKHLFLKGQQEQKGVSEDEKWSASAGKLPIVDEIKNRLTSVEREKQDLDLSNLSDEDLHTYIIEYEDLIENLKERLRTSVSEAPPQIDG